MSYCIKSASKYLGIRKKDLKILINSLFLKYYLTPKGYFRFKEKDLNVCKQYIFKEGISFLTKHKGIFINVNIENKSYSRKKILERDNYTCRLCGETECEFNVHHLTPRSLKGSNHPNNLITLCESCHFFMHVNPKLILRQKQTHSENIKKAIKKSREEGTIIGRPIGSKDNKQRNTDGYFARWGTLKKLIDINYLKILRDEKNMSWRQLFKEYNKNKEGKDKISFSTLKRRYDESKL